MPTETDPRRKAINVTARLANVPVSRRTDVLDKRKERKPYGREPWPVETLSPAVARNYSIAGVLSELGCTVSGSNYRWVHRLVEKYSLDTAHWLGEATCAASTIPGPRRFRWRKFSSSEVHTPTATV
jgi:hypothetical protein